MTSRHRPRRSGSIELDIRMRSVARRTSYGLRASPDAAHTSPGATHTSSSDLAAERELIAERIDVLKAELAEQQRCLQAIDLLLAVEPMT